MPVVHLSVHPSAWASAPPSVATSAANPAPPAAATSIFPQPTPTSHSVGGDRPAPVPPPSIQHSGPSPSHRPAQLGASSHPPAALPATTSVPGLAPISVGYINYVAYQHLSAASVLRSGRMADDSPPAGLAESKNLAKQLMTQWGYQWPSVFDEEYPPAQDETAGIKYETVTIEWVSPPSLTTRILTCVITVARIISGLLIHPGRPRHYKRTLFVFWSILLHYSRCRCRLRQRIRSLPLHRPTHTFLFMSMRIYSRSACLLFVFARKMQ